MYGRASANEKDERCWGCLNERSRWKTPKHLIAVNLMVKINSSGTLPLCKIATIQPGILREIPLLNQQIAVLRTLFSAFFSPEFYTSVRCWSEPSAPDFRHTRTTLQSELLFLKRPSFAPECLLPQVTKTNHRLSLRSPGYRKVYMYLTCIDRIVPFLCSLHRNGNGYV